MKDLHLEAGLIPVGENKDREMEYLGPQERWNKYDELVAEHDCHQGPDDACPVCDTKDKPE